MVAILTIIGGVSNPNTQAVAWSAWKDVVSYTIPASKGGLYIFDADYHIATDYAPSGGGRVFGEARIRHQNAGQSDDYIADENEYVRNFDTGSSSGFWHITATANVRPADTVTMQVRVRRQANTTPDGATANTVAANATFAADKNRIIILRLPESGEPRFGTDAAFFSYTTAGITSGVTTATFIADGTTAASGALKNTDRNIYGRILGRAMTGESASCTPPANWMKLRDCRIPVSLTGTSAM